MNQCNHAIANHNESHNVGGGGDDKTVVFCKSHGISYSAFSPLEGLSGYVHVFACTACLLRSIRSRAHTFRRTHKVIRLCLVVVCREDVFKIPEVISIGKAHQKSAAQVALRWLIQQNISAVTAAHNPAYIAEDIGQYTTCTTLARTAC